MDKIIEIKQKATELVEKRSWIRKSFIELIEMMNQIVADVPDSDEPSVEVVIDKSVNEYEEREDLVMALEFNGDAYFTFYRDYYRTWEDQGRPFRRRELNPEKMYVSTIRTIASKLPDALDQMLDYIEKRLKDRHDVIQLIERMKNALKEVINNGGDPSVSQT